MATMRLSNPRNPTIDQVRQAEVNPPMPGITREEVIEAAKLRGIPVRDGRLALGRFGVGALYFGLRAVRLESTTEDFSLPGAR